MRTQSNTSLPLEAGPQTWPLLFVSCTPTRPWTGRGSKRQAPKGRSQCSARCSENSRFEGHRPAGLPPVALGPRSTWRWRRAPNMVPRAAQVAGGLVTRATHPSLPILRIGGGLFGSPTPGRGLGDLNGEVKSESVSLLKVLLFTISTKFRRHPVYVSLVWLLAGLPGQPACKLAGLLPAQTKNSVRDDSGV